MRFSSASSFCEDSSGYLVKVDNADVRSFIIQYMSSTNYYWIGLSDVAGSNNPSGYKWIIDNKIASTYVNWASNQPNCNYHDCVMYKNEHGTWYWYDLDCQGHYQDKAYYICQRGNKISNGSFNIIYQITK